MTYWPNSRPFVIRTKHEKSFFMDQYSFVVKTLFLPRSQLFEAKVLDRALYRPSQNPTTTVHGFIFLLCKEYPVENDIENAFTFGRIHFPFGIHVRSALVVEYWLAAFANTCRIPKMPLTMSYWDASSGIPMTVGMLPWYEGNPPWNCKFRLPTIAFRATIGF